ncbi:MAG: divergent PAP2 family protein [bacterium]|nr:divergent PAP2 family protein [bacterium]
MTSDIAIYYPLYSAVISMLTAQTLKIFYALHKYQNLKLKEVFTSGGMPSSHSAMVTGLTVAIGLKEGWSSSLFGICVVFSAIVLYDAAGVRQAVGEQAALLNQLIDNMVAKKGFQSKKITEILGHTPLEVVVGCLLGIIIAVVLYKLK